MSVKNGVAFHVSRHTKTGKSVTVGNFDALQQAQEAMLEHYKSTPKRGDFYYNIVEAEVHDMNGRTMLTMTFDRDKFFKRYTRDELKNMV